MGLFKPVKKALTEEEFKRTQEAPTQVWVKGPSFFSSTAGVISALREHPKNKEDVSKDKTAKNNIYEIWLKQRLKELGVTKNTITPEQKEMLALELAELKAQMKREGEAGVLSVGKEGQ